MTIDGSRRGAATQLIEVPGGPGFGTRTRRNGDQPKPAGDLGISPWPAPGGSPRPAPGGSGASPRPSAGSNPDKNEAAVTRAGPATVGALARLAPGHPDLGTVMWSAGNSVPAPGEPECLSLRMDQ